MVWQSWRLPGADSQQLWDTGVARSARCPWLPSSAPAASLGHPSAHSITGDDGPNPKTSQDVPAPRTPCSCITPLKRGDAFVPSQTPCRAGGAGGSRVQLYFVFLLSRHLCLVRQIVPGHTLNSPDSSGGVSRGQQCCLRPLCHGHAHQSWPFPPTSGISLWRGCPWGWLRSPLTSTASKPPHQILHPAPSLLVGAQRRLRMQLRTLAQASAVVLHPSMSSPRAPLPRIPACERGYIYLSVQHPSVHPCPWLLPSASHVPLPQGLFLWQAPELPVPWWPDSTPLVLWMCRVCLAQRSPRSPKSPKPFGSCWPAAVL